MLEKIFTFANLYKAHMKTRRGKLYKKEVASFEIDSSYELNRLYEELSKGQYVLSPYKTFYLYEPKKRRVDATAYRDRVVQSCLVDHYLRPLLERHLIYDNAACRVNKGTDFARKRVRGFITRLHKECGSNFYVLSFDVHHYFESIDHEILKEKLKRVVKEEDVLSFLFMIIDSYESEPGKGLPLGNQTSQWFALLYLDKLDRILKERYRIKYYSRYMDDGIAFSSDKSLLKEALKAIGEEAVSLKLSFNPGKTMIFPIKQGFSYLGFSYRLLPSGKILSFMEKKKRRRLLRHLKASPLDPSILFSYIQYLKQRSNHHSLILYLKEEMREPLLNEERRDPRRIGDGLGFN